jgi:uncharacterized protein YbjT (DUF2867 family)
MKVVVIGGSGLIGTKVVANLRQQGHNVIAASPSTGINTITGEGLAEAMSNTDVVIDLANAPSFEDKAVMEFFQTAGRNFLGAEIVAGIRHHLALSIVGTELMPNIGYMRAKKVQEDLIKQSGVPYTIIRSTQFLEFLPGIVSHAAKGDVVPVSDVQFQPIAADDVAHFVSVAALAAPINGTIEIAGPERSTMPEFVSRYLKAINDPRKVAPDSNNQYYGGEIPNNALVPFDGHAQLGATSYEKWLSGQLQHA